MEITYYGHSCFMVEMGDYKVLFDPFIRNNELAKDININDINPDYILLSHGHFDHVADAEEIAKRSGATILANYEVASWYENKGVEKVFKMNIGGRAILEFGTVKLVNAIHSSTLPDGSPGGAPGGFVIESGEKTFYYSGDTALYSDMQLISEIYHIDFAFLCMGDVLTMDIMEAMKAARMLKTNKIIGMHYNTWPNIEVDEAFCHVVAKQAGMNLTLMEIGEKIKL